MQPGLFDIEFRLNKIDANGDPLKKINDLINWEMFRTTLESARVPAERKSPAGRKPWDAVLMFKVLILQSLYGLSDDDMEQQLLDRLSFMRFVGVSLGGRVPDAKTIWLFREQLKCAEVIDDLFDGFNVYLSECGFEARSGQIVDASLVEVPVQRNTREENEMIRKGETPDAWEKTPAKQRQKDTDAQWTKKRGKSYYGYKNHVSVDVEHKLIRRWEATDASVHDSQMLPVLLDEDNTSTDVYGDSAYRSQGIEKDLKSDGYRSRIHRKANRNRPLSKREKQGNKTKSRIRARIEHVYGVMSRRVRGHIMRGVGWKRVRLKIGLRNLAYNIDRYAMLRLRQS